MSVKHVSALLLVLALVPVACDGAADPAKAADAAYADLGRSDYPAALKKFQEALKGMQPSDPQYMNLKLGEIEAWAYVDAAKAKDEFLALAKSSPDKVTAKDYRKIASNLTSARKFDPAIAVLASGLEKFPQDESVKKLGETIKAEATKAGDSAALDKLRGMGYL